MKKNLGDFDDTFLCFGHKIIGLGSDSIIVPLHTSKELVNNIAAAKLAHHLGLSSIDYAKKKYVVCKDEENIDPIHVLFWQTSQEIHEVIENIFNKRSVLNGLPDAIGLVAAGVSFFRLQSSWKNYLILCSRGAKYDAFTILKLILEQLAWAITVYKINDASLFKIQPSASIRSLKFIKENVGKLYGDINEYAHISTKVIHEFVYFDDSDAHAVIASKEATLESLPYAFELADLMGIVNEIIWGNFYDNFQYCEDNKETFKLLKIRPAQEAYKNFLQANAKYKKLKNTK